MSAPCVECDLRQSQSGLTEWRAVTHGTACTVAVMSVHPCRRLQADVSWRAPCVVGWDAA